MTVPILSLGILTLRIRGARGLTSARGAGSASAMIPRMCRRPSRACASASCITEGVMPVILMSICSAVTPSRVPQTLKSMSPRASSLPRMSDSTA